MAKKKAKKQESSSSDNVVRIKAGAASSAKSVESASETVVTKTVVKADAKKTAKVEKPAKVKKPRTKKAWTKPFRATGGYFKGAWVELRQVHWPTRQATWKLTGAVLLYSAFFVILVLLLDALFKYLFELILGK